MKANLYFFRQLQEQMQTFWRQLTFPQKGSLVSILLIAVALLTFVFVSNTSTRYTPLFLGAQIDSSEVGEVLGYLDNKDVTYLVKDKTIMVPFDRANSLRMELAEMGLPKTKHSQGFELFDSPTWIKGEKELQVLEMRALKGQLESDIASYDNIISATINLEISPPRPFGGSLYKSSASILLKLRPGARLSNSELRAITFHLSGAVRGLEPNMIAVSDTTGHLYQAIDPDGAVNNIQNEEVDLEDHIKAKIDGLLAMVFGVNNFYTTVQVVMSREQRTEHKTTYKETIENNNRNTSTVNPTNSIEIKASPGKIQNISASVLIDEAVFAKQKQIAETNLTEDAKTLETKSEITNQVMAIIKGYDAPVNIAVNFVELKRTAPAEVLEETVWSPEKQALIKPTLMILFISLFAIFLIAIFIKVLMIKISNQKPTEQESEISSKTVLNEIHRKIHQNPEEASQKLKDWIKRS